MKKAFLALAFILAAVSTSFAQKYDNSVKANPLSLLGGTDLVSYERAFGEHSTGIIGLGLGGFKFGSVEYKSRGAQLQYRYYFNEAIHGWYGGAIVQYQIGEVESEGTDFSFDGSSITTEDTKVDFGAFGAGIKGGYQWAWDSGFTLDLNLGFNYASFSYDDEEDDTLDLRGSGILPSFGFGLGYSW